MERILNLNKLVTIIYLSWMTFFSKLISVFPQPSLFLRSWFHMHMGYLKVHYVKKYSDKFSVSSNICTRNLTINSNLSQGCFGMPNRIHASLAKSFIFPANKMNSGLKKFNLMHCSTFQSKVITNHMRKSAEKDQKSKMSRQILTSVKKG